MPLRSPPRRRGTTLIEVLLGLVILSTLLVSVAMARGRFMRQWADADRRIAQTKAVDDLVSHWLAGPPESVPLAGQGVVDGNTWRTRLVRSQPAATLGAVVVRLELFDRSNAPAVTLDFLLHDARRPATQPAAR